uniref:Uncharacterized protein n=1 Tax=Oryza glumipatula TaxID=40148 RepID=A0A0E0BQT2_9ORYZ
MGEASQLTETWRGQKRDEAGMGDNGDSGIPLISRLNKGVDEDSEDEGGETGDDLFNYEGLLGSKGGAVVITCRGVQP